MKRTILLITILAFILPLGIFSQQQTADGGYIIAGTTQSYVHGADPDTDYLVYKLDAAGAKQWRKNFGGADSEYYARVIQTADGGYAVCGHSYSYANGTADFLVYKLDASGAKQWRKNYGGTGWEDCYNIVQTSDGGFAISGYTDSYTNGYMDLLVYRVDAAGAKLWRKNFGGAEYEGRGYIIQTSDGGFILCGNSSTYCSGSSDFIVYKLDAAGVKQWRKNYGGSDSDGAAVIRQTPDGGYIVGGSSNSYSDMNNFMVYKLDAAGAKQWRKDYGGEYSDHLYDLRRTSDGGYIFFGDSKSYNHSGSDYDFLMYKVDASGAKQWRKNYGGDDGDYGYMAFATADGGYFLFGDTDSYVHGTPGNDSDLLIYKVDAAGTKEWRKNYGGTDHDYAFGK